MIHNHNMDGLKAKHDIYTFETNMNCSNGVLIKVNIEFRLNDEL